MAQAFNLVGNLPAGTMSSTVWTAPAGTNGVQAVISAGPMPDPTTTLTLAVNRSTDGGTTWVTVGGLQGSGGLVGPKGGPYTIPVTISATTYSALNPGDKLQAVATVVNPPSGGLAVSAVGNTF